MQNEFFYNYRMLSDVTYVVEKMEKYPSSVSQASSLGEAEF